MNNVETIEVHHGTTPDGLRWVVRTSTPGDTRTTTMLHVYRGDEHLSGSGFGGPPLPDGRVLRHWRGRTDDQPWFVMACTAPEVTRVVATTDRATEVELDLSDIVNIHAVRYAVAALPRGEGPGTIHAETDGRPAESDDQPVFTTAPGITSAGWSALRS